VKSFALIGLSLVVAGCASDLDEDVSASDDALKVCTTTTVPGIDVSALNGTIDWAKVRGSGVRWAAIKATQGTTHINKTFAANWKNSKDVGIVPTAYHFFDPTKDGVEQANHYLSIVGTLRDGDLPPMLDLECPDGNPQCLGYVGGTGQAPAADISKRALDWLHTVEAATGMRPIVYTFNTYFSGAGVDAAPFAGYPVFIASLTTTSCYNVSSPWTAATMWQYSWTGRVPGIEGNVDLDRFIGTMDDLLALTKRPATSAR
jgi:lysozyme